MNRKDFRSNDIQMSQDEWIEQWAWHLLASGATMQELELIFLGCGQIEGMLERCPEDYTNKMIKAIFKQYQYLKGLMEERRANKK